MKVLNSHLSNILSSLKRDYFNAFIYEMWRMDNISTPHGYTELKKKPRLGSGVIEQRITHWENPKRVKTYQGFNLIVPFFQPIELLLFSNDFFTCPNSN